MKLEFKVDMPLILIRTLFIINPSIGDERFPAAYGAASGGVTCFLLSKSTRTTL